MYQFTAVAVSMFAGQVDERLVFESAGRSGGEGIGDTDADADGSNANGDSGRSTDCRVGIECINAVGVKLERFPRLIGSRAKSCSGETGIPGDVAM
jgi:hypothetical protein